MPTVLGFPMLGSNSTLAELANEYHVLIATSNILGWLIVVWFLYMYILENRRVQARYLEKLELERRVYLEGNRRLRAVEQLEQILEEEPKQDGLEQHDLAGEDDGFEIVQMPERRPQTPDGLHVEEDLEEAMEEELAARGGLDIDIDDFENDEADEDDHDHDGNVWDGLNTLILRERGQMDGGGAVPSWRW